MKSTGMGARLLARRTALGWTQEQLAHHAGMVTRTIVSMELEDRPGFQHNTIRKIARALGVRVGWLSDGELPMMDAEP